MTERPQHETARPPARTVVVLGASNVTRTLGTAYCVARAVVREPLDFVLAVGHGRSFGQESSYFGRVLPGILHCGLWSNLEQLAPSSMIACITDVGNDLAYGVAPATIAAWVEECVTRLAARGGITVLSQLPLASLGQLGPRRFGLFRRLIFPRATLELADVLRDVADLSERLRGIATRHGVTLLDSPAHWYGLDPIHVRRRCAVEAWQSFWSAAKSAGEVGAPPVAGSWTRWWTHRRLRRARPLQQFRHGRDERYAQPALRLPDGSRIWSF